MCTYVVTLFADSSKFKLQISIFLIKKNSDTVVTVRKSIIYHIECTLICPNRDIMTEWVSFNFVQIFYTVTDRLSTF